MKTKVTKPYIKSIAKEFWKKAGFKPKPPYDIQGAVSLNLPIDIVCLSELTVRKIEQWLLNRNVTFSIGIDDRCMHGFILTKRGNGFIFINGTDNYNERRFSIAHEVSHFLLDYKIPRDKAVESLGVGILEVLDGLRQPSYKERIDGILSTINIQPFTHFLEKSGDGSFASLKVFDAENDADSLALELLAPSTKVIKKVRENSDKLIFSEFRKQCYYLLLENYGLPETISEEYSSRIAYAVLGGPSIITKLGL